MKARKLKEILNTGYIIHQTNDKICIASPYISDLISVDKKTFKIKYALDTFNEGKSSVNNGELLDIWNKLEDLIQNGEFQDIINGNDELKNPIEIYYEEDGIIKTTYTDEYGYPNVTYDGYIIYNNIYFTDKLFCKNKAIKDYLESIETYNSYIQQQVKEVDNLTKKIENFSTNIKKLLKI